MTREAMDSATIPPIPGLEEAQALLLEWDSWVLETQMELTAIPAPPFGEGPRGERMAEGFREVGLTRVWVDEVGNVLAFPGEADPGFDPAGGDSHGAVSRGRAEFGETGSPGHSLPAEPGPFILSAHLDTVFPAGTDVTPRITDPLIRAPGIADDGRGLAALLAIARVVSSVPLPLPSPLLFVATVGEEGAGNLRGVRHLFREGGPASGARGFISLDGVGVDRIITRGVGSTRLRITIRGPGGHSWTDWGLPNPIQALGRIVTGLEEIPLPTAPRTTATVARWGGGKSINAIPQEAWMEVDLRSEGKNALGQLEEAFLSLCHQAVDESAPGGKGPGNGLEMEVSEIGRRPAGAAREDAALVRAAAQATSALGFNPQFVASSTDANVPMALGIPAVTLGAGGQAGGIHTLDEWYSNLKGPEGILRTLLTLVLLG